MFRFFLSIVFFTIALFTAYASVNREYFYLYYVNASESGVTHSIAVLDPCNHIGRGCVVNVPELGGAQRQLFVEDEFGATIPVKP